MKTQAISQGMSRLSPRRYVIPSGIFKAEELRILNFL